MLRYAVPAAVAVSADGFEGAVAAVEETGLLAALTRGAAGSVVVAASGPVAVAAEPVEHVVDTTGAGDLYAAGFLYGLTHGYDPEGCARLAGLCAGEVISHLRDHSQQVFARVRGRRFARMRDPAGLARGRPGYGRERLGGPPWRQFAGPGDKHGAIAGVETQVLELVKLVLGEPLQQSLKNLQFAGGQAFTHRPANSALPWPAAPGRPRLPPHMNCQDHISANYRSCHQTIELSSTTASATTCSGLALSSYRSWLVMPGGPEVVGAPGCQP